MLQGNAERKRYRFKHNSNEKVNKLNNEETSRQRKKHIE